MLVERHNYIAFKPFLVALRHRLCSAEAGQSHSGHQFWQLDASHFHTCFLPNVFSLNESWLFTHRKIVISYDEQANPTVWVVNICWSYFKNHRKMMVLMISGWKTSISRGTNWSWSWGSHWMARCDLWPEEQQSKRSWDLTALTYESDSEGNARRCTLPIIFSLVQSSSITYRKMDKRYEMQLIQLS